MENTLQSIGTWGTDTALGGSAAGWWYQPSTQPACWERHHGWQDLRTLLGICFCQITLPSELSTWAEPIVCNPKTPYGSPQSQGVRYAGSASSQIWIWADVQTPYKKLGDNICVNYTSHNHENWESVRQGGQWKWVPNYQEAQVAAL